MSKKLGLILLLLIPIFIFAQAPIKTVKLTIPSSSVAPSPNTDALYSMDHKLFWQNVRLDTVYSGANVDTSYIATRYWVGATYEPKIGTGTTNQYWRGDKTWQTVPTGTQWTTEADGIYYNGKIGVGIADVIATDSSLQALSIHSTRDINVNGLTVGQGNYKSKECVAIGISALSANGTGWTTASHGANNIAVGSEAMKDNTLGHNSIAIGQRALWKNTEGFYNIGIGTQSLVNNTTGNQNIAIGHVALGANNGSYNLAIGYYALKDNSSGNENVALGYQTMYKNTTGVANTGVGALASFTNNTGSRNTSIGDSALYYVIGSGNVAIGAEAGKWRAYYGGSTLTSANNGIFIGKGASASANSKTNEIAIGWETTAKGSNTTILGNTLTTDTYLMGALTIDSIPNDASADSVVTVKNGKMYRALYPTAGASYTAGYRMGLAGTTFNNVSYWKDQDTLNVADGLVLSTSKKLSAVTNNSANWNNAYSTMGYGGWYGMVDNTETTITFNPTDTTLTLAKTGASWRYVRDGLTYTISSNKTATFPAGGTGVGTFYFYIDATDGTITCSATAWTLKDSKVMIAVVKWNKNAPGGFKYFIEDERHGGAGGTEHRMWPRGLHYYVHSTIGTRYQSGGAISGETVLPGAASSANNQFKIAEAEIDDEDLDCILPVKGKPTTSAHSWLKYYRTASTTWTWDTTAVPYPYSATYIQWDNAGTMTTGINNRYYNSYILFTNALDSARFIIVPGRGEFTSLALAQAENPLTFSFTGFSIAESVIMYQLTWNTGNTFTGALGRVKLAATPRLISQGLAAGAVPIPTESDPFSFHKADSLQDGEAETYYHARTTYAPITWTQGTGIQTSTKDTIKAKALDVQVIKNYSGDTAILFYNDSIHFDKHANFHSITSDSAAILGQTIMHDYKDSLFGVIPYTTLYVNKLSGTGTAIEAAGYSRAAWFWKPPILPVQSALPLVTMGPVDDNDTVTMLHIKRDYDGIPAPYAIRVTDAEDTYNIFTLKMNGLVEAQSMTVGGVTIPQDLSGYVTAETDPVWISDSTDYLHKSDTNSKVASRKWVTDNVSASQWVTTGSDIYYTTGKVGVGKTNPTAKLQVNSNKGIQFATSSDADGSLGDSIGIYVDTRGYVGIGTSVPSYKFHVTGNVYSTATVYASSGLAFLTSSNISGSTNGELLIKNANTGASSAISLYTKNTEKVRIDPAGLFGIGSTAPTSTLYVNSKSASVPQFRTVNSMLAEATPTDSLGLFVDAKGYVGVGNTAPTSPLDVTGLATVGTLKVGAYNVSVTDNVSLPQTSVSGNAGTVTNGLYTTNLKTDSKRSTLTTSAYNTVTANAVIDSVAALKAAVAQVHYVGTTSIAANRGSASQALTGITSIDGTAANITGIAALANGGTAANLTASNGGIVYSGASAFAVLAGTATAGQSLLSGASTTPSWGRVALAGVDTTKIVVFNDTIGTGSTGKIQTKYNTALTYAPKASPTFTGTATIPNTLNTAIPGTDHTTSGTLISLTATANSAIGDVIYIASTGKGTFCKADAIANCPYALAICADATINADAAGNWLTRGQIRDDTWNWTVGGLIYISTTGTTGNTLTQTAPSAANNVIMAVGVALSADVMYFFGNIISIEHN